MVVAVLSTAGDQVPVIPLDDVTGNIKTSPEQIGAIAVNEVETIGFTTTVMFALTAH